VKKRTVTFRPAAEEDLNDLYGYVTAKANSDVAFGYIQRIENACLGLAEFPERGSRRDDLYPGIRLVGFERRITIAFMVEEKAVRIVRIFFGVRDLEGAFEDGI
jgi:toxin ParE1/3/4